eukprot:g59472.t1
MKGVLALFGDMRKTNLKTQHSLILAGPEFINNQARNLVAVQTMSSSKALKLMGLNERQIKEAESMVGTRDSPRRSQASFSVSSDTRQGSEAESRTRLDSIARYGSFVVEPQGPGGSIDATLEKQLNALFPTLVCLKSEVLFKLGSRRLLKSMTPKWQKRFVVLEPKGLRYFAWGVTGKLELRGTIALTTASSVTKCDEEGGFEVTPHPGARTYAFKCQPASSLNGWLNAVSQAIASGKDLNLEHERIVKLFKQEHPTHPPFTRSDLLAVYHPAINVWKTRLVTLDRSGVAIWSTEKLKPKGMLHFAHNTQVNVLDPEHTLGRANVLEVTAGQQLEADHPPLLLNCLDQKQLSTWKTAILAEVATILPDVSAQTKRQTLMVGGLTGEVRNLMKRSSKADMNVRLAEVKLKAKFRVKNPHAPPVLYEGLLHKTDSKMRKWSRRYVLLFADKLAYCDTNTLKQKGEIPLTSQSIIELELDNADINRQYCFSVAVQEGWRTYMFSADADIKAQSWVRAIKEAASKLPTVSSLAALVADKNKKSSVAVREAGRGGAKSQLASAREARRKRDRLMNSMAMPSPMQLPPELLRAVLNNDDQHAASGHLDALAQSLLLDFSERGRPMDHSVSLRSKGDDEDEAGASGSAMEIMGRRFTGSLQDGSSRARLSTADSVASSPRVKGKEIVEWLLSKGHAEDEGKALVLAESLRKAEAFAPAAQDSPQEPEGFSEAATYQIGVPDANFSVKKLHFREPSTVQLNELHSLTMLFKPNLTPKNQALPSPTAREAKTPARPRGASRADKTPPPHAELQAPTSGRPDSVPPRSQSHGDISSMTASLALPKASSESPGASDKRHRSSSFMGRLTWGRRKSRNAATPDKEAVHLFEDPSMKGMMPNLDNSNSNRSSQGTNGTDQNNPPRRHTDEGTANGSKFTPPFKIKASRSVTAPSSPLVAVRTTPQVDSGLAQLGIAISVAVPEDTLAELEEEQSTSPFAKGALSVSAESVKPAKAPPLSPMSRLKAKLSGHSKQPSPGDSPGLKNRSLDAAAGSQKDKASDMGIELSQVHQAGATRKDPPALTRQNSQGKKTKGSQVTSVMARFRALEEEERKKKQMVEELKSKSRKKFVGKWAGSSRKLLAGSASASPRTSLGHEPEQSFPSKPWEPPVFPAVADSLSELFAELDSAGQDEAKLAATAHRRFQQHLENPPDGQTEASNTTLHQLHFLGEVDRYRALFAVNECEHSVAHAEAKKVVDTYLIPKVAHRPVGVDPAALGGILMALHTGDAHVFDATYATLRAQVAAAHAAYTDWLAKESDKKRAEEDAPWTRKAREREGAPKLQELFLTEQRAWFVAFNTFLKSSGDQGPFLFLLCVHKYNAMLAEEDRDLAKVRDEAKRITDMFLRSGASQYIDIETSLSAPIIEAVDGPALSWEDCAKLFQDAYKSLMEETQDDLYEDFLETAEAAELISANMPEQAAPSDRRIPLLSDLFLPEHRAWYISFNGFLREREAQETLLFLFCVHSYKQLFSPEDGGEVSLEKVKQEAERITKLFLLPTTATQRVDIAPRHLTAVLGNLQDKCDADLFAATCQDVLAQLQRDHWLDYLASSDAQALLKSLPLGSTSPRHSNSSLLDGEDENDAVSPLQLPAVGASFTPDAAAADSTATTSASTSDSASTSATSSSAAGEAAQDEVLTLPAARQGMPRSAIEPLHVRRSVEAADAPLVVHMDNGPASATTSGATSDADETEPPVNDFDNHSSEEDDDTDKEESEKEDEYELELDGEELAEGEEARSAQANNDADDGAVAGPVVPKTPQSRTKKLVRRGSMARVENEPGFITSMDGLEVVGTLGRGAYSHVQLVREAGGKKTYALKALNKAHILKTQQVDHVKSEKKTLYALRGSDRYVQIRGFFQSAHLLHFVMDPIMGGEVTGLLNKHSWLEEDVVRFLMADLALTFQHLHSLGIAYRDLKPENVLLSRTGYPVLTDFGFAKKIGDGRTNSKCGTPDYMAPEILELKPYGKDVDWWTFGVLLYELMVGTPPFFDENPYRIMTNIITGNMADIPEECSADAVSIIHAFLQKDASKRYGVAGLGQIQEHAFFAPIDFEALKARQLEAPEILIPQLSSETDLSMFEDNLGEDDQWEDYVPPEGEPDPFADF